MLKSLVSAAAPFAPLVLAESTTGFSGNELLVWLAILSFCAVLYNQLNEAWRNKTRGLKEKPRPADTYQTLAMCNTLHHQSQGKADEMKAEFNGRMTGLSAKVETLRAEVRADFQNVLRSLGRVEGKIDAGN